MEPHRNIVRNWKKHPAVLRDENPRLNDAVGQVCFYVPQPALTKEGWFKRPEVGLSHY